MMQVTKVWWDGERLMAEPIPVEQIYKEAEQPAQQQCKHKWKNISSKHQTVYQCEVCGIYTFEQPAQPSKPLTNEMDRQAARIEDYSQRNLFITGWLCAEAAHGIKGDA